MSRTPPIRTALAAAIVMTLPAGAVRAQAIGGVSQISPPAASAVGADQISPRGASVGSAQQISPRADSATPAQQISPRGASTAPAQQLSPRSAGKEAPASISSRAAGRNVAAPPVQGRDRCDAAASTASSGACAGILDSRADEFQKPEDPSQATAVNTDKPAANLVDDILKNGTGTVVALPPTQ